jgi:hypothetical protein
MASPQTATAPQLREGQAQLAAVMEEVVRLLLARQDAVLAKAVERAAGAPAGGEGGRKRARVRDPQSLQSPPDATAPLVVAGARPRAQINSVVRTIISRELSAYLQPLDAYCLSLTCKELVPIARKYNRAAAVALIAGTTTRGASRAGTALTRTRNVCGS